MTRLHLHGFALVAGLLCSPSAVSAQSLPEPALSGVPDTLRLTDEQKMAVLNGNTEQSVDDARAGLGGADHSDRAIHGEFGAMIGSRGTRGVFGTAAIPLGDHAGAVVSFESSRFGSPR